MTTCAYCGKPCVPTREHVIPDWYCRTTGQNSTFSARAPITHVRGDLIVKDVCGVCNSGPLGDLDSYGKSLFDRYFASPVYSGETVDFEYDGERLVRWLLKVSFNSARAQNADVSILTGYRDVILGTAPVPEQVRCWLHFVTPTHFLEDGTGEAAVHLNAGEPSVSVPKWFRICQFRLPDQPAFDFAQRQVLVNCYVFTLLVAPCGNPDRDAELERLAGFYFARLPSPVAIVPTPAAKATVSAGNYHAVQSIASTVQEYPARFTEDKNPHVVRGLKGETSAVVVHIPRELIEEGDVEATAATLDSMVYTRERADAFCQRVALWVDGYDQDARELWEIADARNYFRKLFLRCPFVMLLAKPDGLMLNLLLSCWLHEDAPLEEVRKGEQISEFLGQAFRGLNESAHRLFYGDDIIRSVTDSAMGCLFNLNPRPEPTTP